MSPFLSFLAFQRLLELFWHHILIYFLYSFCVAALGIIIYFPDLKLFTSINILPLWLKYGNHICFLLPFVPHFYMFLPSVLPDVIVFASIIKCDLLNLSEKVVDYIFSSFWSFRMLVGFFFPDAPKLALFISVWKISISQSLGAGDKFF